MSTDHNPTDVLKAGCTRGSEYPTLPCPALPLTSLPYPKLYPHPYPHYPPPHYPYPLSITHNPIPYTLPLTPYPYPYPYPYHYPYPLFITYPVLGGDIAPCLDQQSYALNMTLISSPHERCHLTVLYDTRIESSGRERGREREGEGGRGRERGGGGVWEEVRVNGYWFSTETFNGYYCNGIF